MQYPVLPTFLTRGLLLLVASLVAGFLWDRVGYPAVFYYGAVFALSGWRRWLR
jgi:hypothetical protein